MANKTLSTVTAVKSVSKSDTVIIEQSGGVRRITVNDLADSLGDLHSTSTLKTFYNNPDPYSPILAQSGNHDVVTDYLTKSKAYVFNSAGTKKAEILRCSGTDPTSSMAVVFKDGTQKNISDLNAAGCNFMVYRPELGILSTTEDNQDVLYFAGTGAINGGYQMPAKYIGMFKAYKDGTKLKSQPNRIPTGSQNIQQFTDAAKAGGAAYGLWNFTDWCKENAIHLSYFGNTNYEVNVGTGRIGDTTEAGYNAVRNIVTGHGFLLVGTNTTAGILPTGTQATTDANGAAVNVLMFFGLEGLGEQIWEFVGGIRFDDTNGYVWNNNVWSETMNDVTTRSFSKAITGPSGGYIMKVRGGKFFNMLPTTVAENKAANAVKGFCDGSLHSTTGRCMAVGGYAGDGSRCGLAASSSSLAFSGSYSSYGARLAFYGDPQTVSGSEILS